MFACLLFSYFKTNFLLPRSTGRLGEPEGGAERKFQVFLTAPRNNFHVARKHPQNAKSPNQPPKCEITTKKRKNTTENEKKKTIFFFALTREK